MVKWTTREQQHSREWTGWYMCIR